MPLLEQRNDWADKADWNFLDKQVAGYLEAKEYRPVALALIRDAQGRVLSVRSAKNRTTPNLPQGGIDNESLIAALFREVYEELGITAGQLRIMRFIDTHREEHPDASDKRGFTKGKAYFAFELRYDGPERLKIRAPDEIASYEWVEPRDATAFESMRNAFKRRIVQEALSR